MWAPAGGEGGPWQGLRARGDEGKQRSLLAHLEGIEDELIELRSDQVARLWGEMRGEQSGAELLRMHRSGLHCSSQISLARAEPPRVVSGIPHWDSTPTKAHPDAIFAPRQAHRGQRGASPRERVDCFFAEAMRAEVEVHLPELGAPAERPAQDAAAEATGRFKSAPREPARRSTI